MTLAAHALLITEACTTEAPYPVLVMVETCCAEIIATAKIPLVRLRPIVEWVRETHRTGTTAPTTSALLRSVFLQSTVSARGLGVGTKATLFYNVVENTPGEDPPTNSFIPLWTAAALRRDGACVPFHDAPTQHRSQKGLQCVQGVMLAAIPTRVQRKTKFFRSLRRGHSTPATSELHALSC